MPKGMNTTKENTPHNFANDKAMASANGKKKDSKKAAATQAITKSPAIVEGRHKRITPEIQDEIREKLIAKDSKGHSYITNFIDAFLKEAKSDPNSRAGMLLASTLFDERLLATLDESVTKQMNRDLSFAIYQIRKTLYDKQQEVFDNDTDKIILAICSRRSGKTELMGRLLVKRLLRPNQHVVYVNRSFDAAVRQISKPFDIAMQAVGDSLKIIQGSIGGGLVKFDNGSWLLIIGNNNAADVNKIRGESVALVIIDEFGHMRHLKELVQEVLQPATIDYADSQMIFVGTPPRTKVSFAHDLWNNGEVKRYHWTFMDNPFIPNKDQVIPQVCAMYGVNPDSMFIRREYFGDINAYDDEAIYIKHFFKEEAPKDRLYHYAYVGVDPGYEDKAAVVGMLADKNTKKLYIVKDWSEAKKGVVERAEKIQEMVNYLKTNYKLDREPQIICDTNEKDAAQDLYTTYHIPNVCLAYKYDKDYALDQLSDWFAASTVVVSTNAKATIEDAENMIWKRDEDTDQVLHELDDDAYHGNAMFAVLYASRQFAYDVMGLIEQNKPAKEITNVQEIIRQNEDFQDNRDIGLLDVGNGEGGRHFVR
jgi:PBSX family phage terminase large subunit